METRVPNGYGFAKFGSLSTNPNWQYAGQWKDGKKTGFGIFQGGTIGRQAGVKYIGNWLNGNMEERENIYSLMVVGTRVISKDLFDGDATFYFSDGSKFNGDWYHGNNPDFVKVLEWHSKQVKSGDSILIKFFLK